MKSVTLAFLVLIASVRAWPQGKFTEVDVLSERAIGDLIISIIEDASQAIKDAGWDPYRLDRFEYYYALSVPSLFRAWIEVDDIALDGISNIVPHSVSYGIISGILTFDISLPEVSGSIGHLSAGVKTFGHDLSGYGGGSASVKEIRVQGRANVNLSASGITINNLQLQLTVGDIWADVAVKIFGHDISAEVNEFVNVTLPEGLVTYSAQINELLAFIVMLIIENIMA